MGVMMIDIRSAEPVDGFILTEERIQSFWAERHGQRKHQDSSDTVGCQISACGYQIQKCCNNSVLFLFSCH